MTPAEFKQTILDPGIAWCKAIPGWTIPFDDRAELLLLAIAGQESEWANVPQGGGGPGRGPWQFEPETCSEVNSNDATVALAEKVCEAATLAPSSVYANLLLHPDVAVAYARMDLWCDPQALPAVGDEDLAWSAYVRIWRPGAVCEGGQRADDARDRWSDIYAQALAAAVP
jgi:hypothetical protein